MWRFPGIAILAALPLLAAEPLSATHTDRFKVAAAGTIRLENSFGEVDIDGWDRPEVEVTVIRSIERRAEAERRLDSVHVTAKQDGNDVAISTVYPPRNGFLHPLSRRSDVEIGCRIHAPRAAKLIVNHNSGGVYIFDMSGDIHATVGNGQITLTLDASRRYAIDAQCGIGAVYSDFEGGARRRHLLGEEFSGPAAAPAANLRLRVSLGDIVISKLQGPPTE